MAVKELVEDVDFIVLISFEKLPYINKNTFEYDIAEKISFRVGSDSKWSWLLFVLFALLLFVFL